jgi:hypothetical protein
MYFEASPSTVQFQEQKQTIELNLKMQLKIYIFFLQLVESIYQDAQLGVSMDQIGLDHIILLFF